jgi:hypothetical protein
MCLPFALVFTIGVDLWLLCSCFSMNCCDIVCHVWLWHIVSCLVCVGISVVWDLFLLVTSFDWPDAIASVALRVGHHASRLRLCRDLCQQPEWFWSIQVEV